MEQPQTRLQKAAKYIKDTSDYVREAKQVPQSAVYEKFTKRTGEKLGQAYTASKPVIGTAAKIVTAPITYPVKKIGEGASIVGDFAADSAFYVADKASEIARNTKYDIIERGLGKEAAEEEANRVEALSRMLEVAEKRPKWADGIAAFFYNVNLVAAFAFDSLLFYTPGRGESPPDVVGFFTKLLVIVAAYAIINIALSLIIYGIFIPVFYASYASSYRCFQTFLRNEYLAYQTKFGVKLLEESGDLKTMGILAVFDTVSHTKHNDSKNVKEYREFINNTIVPTLKTIQTPKLDDKTIGEIKDYFMGLPEEFKKHARRKETYVYTSIQYWVVMLCIVLFVIPIKYTILDTVNSPELPTLPEAPAVVKGTFGVIGKGIGSGLSNLGSMMQKSEKVVPDA